MEIYGLCHVEAWDILPWKVGQDFSWRRNDGSKKPLLLFPFTLAYLVPLIHEYLGDIPLQILYPSESFSLQWVEITGYMFPQTEITNEDDVMMFALANDRELLFAEIDTLPEDDNEDVQNALYQILTKREYKTVCYLASRNELAGQIPLLDAPVSKRKARRAEYIAGRKDEMYASYQKYEYEDFENFSNIYSIPGLVRGFIGQGIAYPESLSQELYALQIFPLDEIASMESDIARECGYEFPQRALLPGRQYKAEHGTLETGRKECPIGELVSSKQSVVSSDGEQQRLYASWPLFPSDTLDLDGAKQRILEVLNNKFLPYWSASPLASLRAALMQNKDVYRIGFRFSVMSTTGDILPWNIEQDSSLHSKWQKHETIIFEYATTRSMFVEVPHDASMKLDESYWLDDILEFLDGRQELYSNFWHRLDQKMIYRLWTCLGANFCNNDLVIKKYRLHFERAARGETSEGFFEEVKKNLIS
jgi:hypothetical protein